MTGLFPIAESISTRLVLAQVLAVLITKCGPPFKNSQSAVTGTIILKCALLIEVMRIGSLVSRCPGLTLTFLLKIARVRASVTRFWCWFETSGFGLSRSSMFRSVYRIEGLGCVGFGAKKSGCASCRPGVVAVRVGTALGFGGLIRVLLFRHLAG